MKYHNKEEIFARISEILVSDFEIQSENITLTATLCDDLDFDSIDKMDIMAMLEMETNKKTSSVKLSEMQTISDVVEHVYDLQVNNLHSNKMI